MKKYVLVALIAIVALGAVRVLEAQDELSLTIEWDTSPPEKERAIWLLYLMARVKYIGEHEDQYEVKPGPIVPKFEEEVEARKAVVQAYKVLREKDEELNIRYFNELVKIYEAGFIREYVWIYLGNFSSSEQPIGLRVQAFDKWRRENVPGHEAETNGNVSFKKVPRRVFDLPPK